MTHLICKDCKKEMNSHSPLKVRCNSCQLIHRKNYTREWQRKNPRYSGSINPMYRPRNKFHFRTFQVNETYIALLSVNGIMGGYSAWGMTREDAVVNVMQLAGKYIKEL